MRGSTPDARPRGLAAALAASVLALPACSAVPATDAASDAAPDTAPTSPTLSPVRPPAVRVTVDRYTSDILPRRLQVRVHQGPGPAVQLRTMTVHVPGFAGDLRSVVDTTSRPDGIVDLPVVLGAAQCAGSAPAEPVRVELTTADATLDLTATEEQAGLLARVWSAECTTREVLRQVPMSWGPRWSRHAAPEGLVAQGWLRVGPVPAGHAATVTRLDGTVLFTPSAGTGLPVRVATGQVREVPVTMSVARCDPHAVAEAKTRYVFGIWVALDGAPARRVTLQPPASAHDDLNAMLDARCSL